MSLLRLPRTFHPVKVERSRADALHPKMPDVARSVELRIEAKLAERVRALRVVEKEERDACRVPGEDYELRSVLVPALLRMAPVYPAKLVFQRWRSLPSLR